MTSEEFENKMFEMLDSQENRDLEEYLLTMIKILSDRPVELASYELILKIFKDSFTNQPQKLNSDWLRIDKSPNLKRQGKPYIPEEFKNDPEMAELSLVLHNSGIIGIEYTMKVLKFQTAELHKMRGKQLDDEWRYFGVTSDTNHTWSNFTPIDNIRQGLTGIYAHPQYTLREDWSTIGEILEFGRIYE